MQINKVKKNSKTTNWTIKSYKQIQIKLKRKETNRDSKTILKESFCEKNDNYVYFHAWLFLYVY